MLYPLKFKKIYKEKVWGGEKIKQLKKDKNIPSNCGECWEISSLQGDVSIITNGFLKNTSLEEAIEIYMEELVGDRIFEKFGIEFPLLIKIIEAKENLSIQVHPDNLVAQKRHNAYGKSELWFVLDAEPDASIISGFKNDSNEKNFREALNNGNPEFLMNKEKVRRGDVFYIPAGRVHSLCAGTTVLEIQQCSDITYRIYDYERNSRELHLDFAFDVIDYNRTTKIRTTYTKDINASNQIIMDFAFTILYIPLVGKIEKSYYELDSCIIFFCLKGQCRIEYEEGYIILDENETILVPAVLKEITLISDTLCELLEIYI